ncbi:MAG: rhomboid family intramembrane serine protease [Acidobacteriota bacterium]
MLSLILLIVAVIFLGIVGSFVPIGNENSTVRRLPWVTFSIMAVNVIIFYVTLPMIGTQMEEIGSHAKKLETFLTGHQDLLADEGVRAKLIDAGMMSKPEAELIEEQFKSHPGTASEYASWLRSGEAQKLRDEFDEKLLAFTDARKESLWYKYGLAPSGEWKSYQLITSAFLHAGNMHLWFNLLFFFAVAFSLEDLWGRGVFIGFYLLGAIVASLPSVAFPVAVPSIGASGAISATMGAFLVRLPTTKIKLFCVPVLAPVWWLRLLIGRKNLIVIVPGYLFLASYFIAQVLSWYFDKKAGSVSNVGYAVHIAGFVFGAAFAFMMKATKTEETYINPKIEGKISFSAAPAVNQSIDLLDRGEVAMAERKLRAYVATQPNDINGLLALIQVYQKVNNFEQLNAIYARLIRLHLSKNDNEAALYAYDNLLSALPDNNLAVRIPVRDWLSVCEYLREAGMNREASVEYERLVDTYPDDPLVSRASLQGGEAALQASDTKRALKLFEIAEKLNPSGPMASRAVAGAEKSRRILAASPSWTKRAGSKPPVVFASDEIPAQKNVETEEVPV